MPPSPCPWRATRQVHSIFEGVLTSETRCMCCEARLDETGRDWTRLDEIGRDWTRLDALFSRPLTPLHPSHPSHPSPLLSPLSPLSRPSSRPPCVCYEARRALLPRPSSLVPRVSSSLLSPPRPSPHPPAPLCCPGAHDARRAVPRPLARDRAKLVRLGLHAQLLLVGAAARRQQVLLRHVLLAAGGPSAACGYSRVISGDLGSSRCRRPSAACGSSGCQTCSRCT